MQGHLLGVTLPFLEVLLKSPIDLLGVCDSAVKLSQTFDGVLSSINSLLTDVRGHLLGVKWTFWQPNVQAAMGLSEGCDLAIGCHTA